MRVAPPAYRLDYHPLLIEEAVLIAVSGHPEEVHFRGERDRLYEMPQGQERECAFHDLHQNWFDRLGLSRPLREAFATWLILMESTSRVVLVKSRSKKDEGAELYQATEKSPGIERERRTILIRLRPEMLARPDDLLPFLRHELLHIVDLLDPGFGYRPFSDGPLPSIADWSQRERYHLLWDITIDGRLNRMGLLEPSARVSDLVAFQRVFSVPAPELEASFSLFFDREGHTHDDLVSFSRFPERGLAGEDSESIGRGRCSLCQFPFEDLPAASGEPPPRVIEIIRALYPSWRPGEPVCPHCIDLLTSQDID